MTQYLVISAEGTSEWKTSFSDVQTYMNELESEGTVSRVTVQKFDDNLLTQAFTYSFNGVSWIK